jgi:hypothetical protein
MRRLFIIVAALQFALSVATAQPAPTSTETPSVSLDQRSTVGAIIIIERAKPLVHLELLSKPETVAVPPLVPLHLLLPGLIGGPSVAGDCRPNMPTGTDALLLCKVLTYPV